MNKQEAMEKRKMLKMKQLDKFCPVIKDKCSLNCICLIDEIKVIRKSDYTESNVHYKAEVYCAHKDITRN